MAPEVPSSIRVFVRWHDQTVFAGEDVKCTITFKNVAQTPAQLKQQRQHQQQQSSQSHRLAPSLSHTRAPASGSHSTPPLSNSARSHHRAALSFSGPPPSSRRSGSTQWPQPPLNAADRRSSHAHKRSVSIVSIGSNATEDHAYNHTSRNESISRPPLRTGRSHNRASSLQIFPRGQPQAPGPQSATFPPKHSNSPTYNGTYPGRSSRRTSSSMNPSSPGINSVGEPRSPKPMPEFRFPAAPPSSSEEQPLPSPGDTHVDGFLSPKTQAVDQFQTVSRPKDSHPVERPSTIARLLSSNSLANGTPRSSGEFYAMSNHSSETLASEYVAQPTPRNHGRTRSRNPTIVSATTSPESLMMGYAQVQGSFSLDGSLVNLAPFEQVKKKAVVGGRGGGVVGLEAKRRESNLLRSFGWGNIGTSIGDLLGANELSTMREIRGATNSKSVPLLSTPQSILFVELQLAPGESRVFEYSLRLPKGLPPSHRGKAVKTSYSLVIGTQRAGGAKEQQVKSVEIPFRVLGSVNSYGEILGHDLMSPYILLRDEAKVKSSAKKNTRTHKIKGSHGMPSTANEFLSYVDELVARSRDERGGGLLSPTNTINSRHPSVFEDATTAKEAIRLAIIRSNLTGDGQQSANRFDIARNGRRVGVVMLTRPAYRLGEVITMVIDFTDGDLPCYAVHTSLETSERVDPSLAVRSESSIQRVTRKVHVMSSEATLYSRRVVFTPTIPISASPEFITSGISLDWKIRVEFVVQWQGNDNGLGSGEPAAPPHPLLEQISRDEKGGLVLVAAENLSCESFDVSVPVRVYGAVGTGLERLERDEASEEGLAV